MTTTFDYKNQAWVRDGKYVRCGHPALMNCGCYGRLHAGEPIAHTQDSDCQLDRFGSCELCGVLHGDPCQACGGKGFHTAQCPESDANYVPQDEQGAVIMLQHAINHQIKRIGYDADAVFVLANAIPDVVVDAMLRGIYIDPLAGAQ